eukprot:TRINITY_DN68053_c14_g1_i1.p1 TRINITY_DN68053_c14_g1~~TRINITY_DN68053_c14_g1_i1.p1  ORF type:complete len:279 (+),score=28.24 TRINITY_DN68053_c14_g1_i1:60-896(+)
MGCGASSVPDVIIPNPEPNVAHKMLLKKQGLMSRDYEVFKDFDTAQKWLFIDKQKNVMSSKDAKYYLENYVREDGKGELLLSAKGDDPDFKFYDFEHHEDSDSSSDSDDSVDWSPDVSDPMYHAVSMKWAQTLKNKIYADRDMSEQIGKLKTKAKGKAVKCFYKRMEDGEMKHWQSTNKRIKKMKYTLSYGPKNADGDHEREVKIKLKGKLRAGQDSKVEWVSDVFEATNDGGWANPQIHTEIKPCEHPAVALMASYLCTVECAPSDILDDVHPPGGP